MEFVCIIPLEPRSWSRNRTNRGRVYRDPKDTAWKRGAVPLLRVAAREACWVRDGGPVVVEIVQVFKRPKGRPTMVHGGERVAEVPREVWATGERVRLVTLCGKDVDRLASLPLDALVDAGVLLDDGQVVELRVSKWWAASGRGACTEMRVSKCGWDSEEVV